MVWNGVARPLIEANKDKKERDQEDRAGRGKAGFKLWIAATQNINHAYIIYRYFLTAVSVMFNLIN